MKKGNRKTVGKYIKIWSLLCAFAILGSVLCSCGKQEEKKEMPTLIVGSDNYPPFNYQSANGGFVGIDADLAREAFRRMGYEAVFTIIDWEKKTELIESGQIDCIWGCFSINGREDQYRWAGPYMASRQVVAVRRDSDIRSLSDLEGRRVAVQSTTKPETIFLSREDSRIPEVWELFCLQNRELLYPYLSKGYVDAIAAHETAILQCMQDYNLEYRILDEPLMEVDLGVAFSKNDTRGLDRQLSEALSQMRADGTMEQIIGKYLAEPKRFMEVAKDEKN